MDMEKFDVQEAVGRIDTWLAARLAVSRAEAQRLIKNGRAVVGGKKVTPHFALKAGDVVEVSRIEAEAAPIAELGPLDIIFEDADVLVVNKPSGMLVHETPGKEPDTLAARAVQMHPEIAAVGESPERPGIVHRLDKDASGVIVVARTQAAHEKLKKQFQEHTIKKEYAVLVHGALSKDEGTISLVIGRSSSHGKMAARSMADAREGDRHAVTHYRVDRRFRDATLVTVRTETGRTHQIRAHFKALGHPVVGDELYAMRHVPRGIVEAPRLFLHAKTLGFTHPTSGELVEYTAPLPAELEAFLSTLR